MRTLKRGQKTIYVCHKYIENNKIFYKEPIAIKEYYATTDNDTDLLAMGMDYIKRLRIKSDDRVCIDGKWLNRATLYHPGDRVYVYVEPPLEHDMMCKNADYEVETPPTLTPNQFSVILVKRSGKN